MTAHKKPCSSGCAQAGTGCLELFENSGDNHSSYNDSHYNYCTVPEGKDYYSSTYVEDSSLSLHDMYNARRVAEPLVKAPLDCSQYNALVGDFVKLVRYVDKSMVDLRVAQVFDTLRSHEYIDDYRNVNPSADTLLAMYRGEHYNPITGTFDRHHTIRITHKGQELLYKILKDEHHAN